MKLLIILSTAANCRYMAGLGHHRMGRDGGEIALLKGRWEPRLAIHVCALTEQPVNSELRAFLLKRCLFTKKKMYLVFLQGKCGAGSVVLGAFPALTPPADTVGAQYLDVVLDQVNG